MNEISEGWLSLPLQDCVYFQEGPGLRKWQFGTSGIPFLNIRTFNNGTIDKTKCQFVKIEEFTGKYEHFLLQNGDIVVSSSGTLGKLVVVREQDLPLMLNTSVIRYRSLYPQHLLQSYLKFFLQSHLFFKQINSSKTGSAILNYGPSHLKEMSIIVPPIEEQRRIVAKLEKLLNRVDGAHARLATIPRILKRYRQSILDSAITGKLTSNWRSGNRQIGNASEEIQAFIKNRRKMAGINLRVEPTEGSELFKEITPASWETPTLGDLFLFIDYRGRNPKKTQQGKRLITAKNIKMGYLSEHPVDFISNEIYKQWMTRGLPKKGDILFVTEGATMGSVALNNRDDEFALAQRTITLQPFYQINTKIFLYFMMSSFFQDIVKLNATGSAAVGIKASRFRGLPIPFPPIAEQEEIVRRVEALLKTADSLEARYRTAKSHVDKLTQSILARAFRGELVTTEAELARLEGRDYEPASVLLERIRQERAQQEASKQSKPKRTPKSKKDTATKKMFA